MKNLNKIRRFVSFCLAWVLMFSLAGPVTAHADLLEEDTLFLPAACDHFGEMEDWLYSDDSEIVIFTFLRKKDPHTEMLSFAEAYEDCGLVLKSDTTTSEGDRGMELAQDGATCVALLWDSSEGRLLVAYEEDTVTISRKQDQTVLYFGMEEWSDAGDFVKQCQKTLGTTSEKVSKLVNGDRSQKLTKDEETVAALHWYSASQILTVTFYDDTAMEKLGIPLDALDQKDETVDPNSRALPDLASFLNTKYTQDEWAYTHYVTCLVNRSNKDAIVKAVLELLQEPRYQLKQMEKKSDSEGTHYTFEYTGKNEDVDWVYLKSGGKYHVKLTVKPYGSSQTALIMYTHPEFYLKDPGSRWEGGDTPNPAPNPNDPEPYDPFDTRDCPDCNNGSCKKCGGDGEIDSYMPGIRGKQKDSKTCHSCYGGRCRTCNGTGRVHN